MSNYVPLNEDGSEVGGTSMSLQAREAKTKIQEAALKACGLEYFPSSKIHKAFKKLEDNAIGSKDSSIIYKYWMWHCIRNHRGNIQRLVEKIGNDVERAIWSRANGNKALEDHKNKQKPAVPLVKASSLPHPITKRKIADEVEVVIAKLEGLLHVNVRRTVPNLTAAESIANDLAEHEDRSIDQWFRWFEGDKWRQEHTEVFANLSKVWESWPKAFAVEEAGMDPQGLEIGV